MCCISGYVFFACLSTPLSPEGARNAHEGHIYRRFRVVARGCRTWGRRVFRGHGELPERTFDQRAGASINRDCVEYVRAHLCARAYGCVFACRAPNMGQEFMDNTMWSTVALLLLNEHRMGNVI